MLLDGNVVRMDKIGRWKLADELTAYQIALLIAGYDPSEFEDDHPNRWPDEVKQDISPFINALKNAARSKKLVIVPVLIDDELDWHNTTIEVESLFGWLRLRNFSDGFFIGEAGEVDKLADETGKFYAPKLAAAVRAWNEVTADPEALSGKSPKRSLEIWLRKHSNEYGLTNKDGNPNELGIEEICKVANWKPAGGASPTPSGKKNSEAEAKEQPTEWVRKFRLPRNRVNPPTRRPNSPFPRTSMDDDIPF
jgi:hypothetical protein